MPRTHDIRLLVKTDAERAQRDLNQIENEIDDLGKSGKRANLVFSNMGKIFTGVVSALAIREVAEFSKRLIKAASDLGEAQNAVAVTFGKSARAVQQFAKTSADAFGISERAALEHASTLGAVFTASGLAEDAAADMAVQVEKLAADLASVRNIGLEDALQKIRSGLVGETEPLRSVGVLLSEAQIQQRAYKDGIAEMGQELTQGQKVQARYNEILAQTASIQGDFGRTSDQLANATRRFEAKIENISSRIGQALLPAASGAIDAFNILFDLFDSGEEDILGLQKATDKAIGSFGDFGLSSADLSDELEDLFTNWGRQIDKIVIKMTDAFKSLSSIGELTTVIDQLRQLQILLGQSGDIEAVTRLANQFQFLTAEQRIALISSRDMWDGIKALGDIANELEDRLNNLSPEVKALPISFYDFATSVKEADESISDLDLEGLKTAAKETRESLAGLNFENTIFDLNSVNKAKESLRVLDTGLADFENTIFDLDSIKTTTVEKISEIQQTINNLSTQQLQKVFDDLKKIFSSLEDKRLEIIARLAIEPDNQKLKDELKKIEKTLPEVNAQLNIISHKVGDNKDIDERVKEQMAALDVKLKLDKIELDSLKDTHEKEIASINVRYDDEIEKAKDSSKLIQLYNRKRGTEIAIVRTRQAGELADKEEQLAREVADIKLRTALIGTKNEFQRRLIEVTASYNEEIAIAREAADQIDKLKAEKQIKIGLAKTDEEKEAIKEFYDAQIALAQTNAEKVTALEEEKAAKIAQIDADLNNNLIQNFDEHFKAEAATLNVFLAGYDSFWQSILDKDLTGKERREQIWRDMQQSLINIVGDMVKTEIEERIKTLVATQSIETAKTAAQTAGTTARNALDQSEIASNTAEQASETGKAASKFFSAHAGIPLAGFAIASGFIAAMVALLASLKGKASGGLVSASDINDAFSPRGEDGVLAVQKGEYVVNRRATQQFLPLLEAINAQRLPELSPPNVAAPVSSFSTTRERIIDRIIPPLSGEVTVKGIFPDTGEMQRFLIKANRDVIMPDQDYVNTFLRTGKSEFDKK